jgi:hypothetical protein
VYAVSTNADRTKDNYPPSAWLDREGWTFPTVADDTSGSAARAFGLRYFPTTVFVNSDGTVVLRVTGAIGPENLLSIFSQMS